MHGADGDRLFGVTSFRGEDNPVFTRSHDQGILWHQAAFSTTISRHEKVDMLVEITRGLLWRDFERFGRAGSQKQSP